MLQQVGRYHVLSQLGKGAMGVVYLADDPLLNRQVAIKTIDLSVEDHNSREFLRGRLLRDARAAASLSHPNIVGIYDVVMEGDCGCVVMEYVAGEDLAAYLSRHPIADFTFTVQVIRAMAAALDYTHSRGIIHRDIKPANVMLDSANTPKITDFGIARITEGATATMTGTVMGTIEYMAPEQVKGETVDGRADQFALAVVAYRMLTGSTLYGSHSVATLAYKIVNEAPQTVRSRNAALPVEIDAVLAKALAKSPEDRYGTCAEFATALACQRSSADTITLAMPEVAAGTVAAATAVTTRTAPAAAPASKSGRRTVLVALGLSAVAGGCAGIFIWKPWMQPAKPATEAVTVSSPAAIPPAQPPPVVTAAVKTQPKATAVKTAPVATTASVTDAGADDEVLPADIPRPAAAAYKQGRELMAQQQFAAAIPFFAKALDIRPKWAQAYLSRGDAYKHLEQYDNAIKDYSQVIQINPKSSRASVERGECYVRLKKDNAAFDDFNQALSLNPASSLALMGRAGVHIRRKGFRKALADLDEAIRLSPELANAYRSRATAKRALGDASGAQADQAKFAELSAKQGRKGG
jgi:eukaryotic-like serine/threonine-protein kinase